MAGRRNDTWDDGYETYVPNQVEGVLRHAEVEIVGETNSHFLCYCPFHGNTDSPAFAVDKYKGLWTCFNPSCTVAGTLPDLLAKTKGLNPFQTLRVINKNKNHEAVDIHAAVMEALEETPEFEEFPQSVLDGAVAAFKGSVAEAYMKSRGFIDSTLEYFGVGYSKAQGMVIVPMHDPKGMPIGLIGRTPSNTEKRFKNSTNLPKSKTMWNFHRAKRTGDTVIVCEASYDAMRIHQAGYPNVVALLGGHVTPYHIQQLGRHFSTIIIMTDFDKKQYRPNCRMCKDVKFEYGEVRCKGHRPGRDLGRQIADALSHKRILWATYDETCVFPNGAKDASDMSDDEIRQCLRNAISHVEYMLWDIEEAVAA